MQNHNDESKKVILGLVIGSVLGASALYFLKAARNRPTPVLQKIGKTISEVGEMIEHSKLGESVTSALHSAEKHTPKPSELVESFMDWASTGMNLWKKLQRRH